MSTENQTWSRLDPGQIHEEWSGVLWGIFGAGGDGSPIRMFGSQTEAEEELARGQNATAEDEDRGQRLYACDTFVAKCDVRLAFENGPRREGREPGTATCAACELEARIRTPAVPHPIDIRLHICPPDSSDYEPVWSDDERCQARRGGMRCDYSRGHRANPSYRSHHHTDSRGRQTEWSDAESDPQPLTEPSHG
jgi:hypothetical protein